MIEAVNSVLSNVSASRGQAEVQSTSRSLAANPQKVQETAQSTPYVSPYISYDNNFNKAVLQIRDSNTGDVVTQYPTETQLRAYQVAQQNSERQIESVVAPSAQPEQTQNVSAPDAAPQQAQPQQSTATVGSNPVDSDA